MDPTFLAASIVILLFSVILHEVMHGYIALQFGDHTAERAGRLTLNPIPHIDLYGTILLPLTLRLLGSPILFGWAKPVPINPLNFNNIRLGELATASAGILSNVGLSLISAILFHLIPANDLIFKGILVYAFDINLILAFFNLIPIPPLDGSKILMSYMPASMEISLRNVERYGIFILLALWLIPFGSGGSLLGTLMGFVLGVFHSLLQMPTL